MVPSRDHNVLAFFPGFFTLRFSSCPSYTEREALSQVIARAAVELHPRLRVLELEPVAPFLSICRHPLWVFATPVYPVFVTLFEEGNGLAASADI
jgi:hypothetical protein